jgi:hypothetical protein
MPSSKFSFPKLELELAFLSRATTKPGTTTTNPAAFLPLNEDRDNESLRRLEIWRWFGTQSPTMSTSTAVRVSQRVPRALQCPLCSSQSCSLCLQGIRYLALVYGAYYGYSTQKQISSNDKFSHAEGLYQQKLSNIQKAKLEWKKKHLPPQAQEADGGSESGGCLKIKDEADPAQSYH